MAGRLREAEQRLGDEAAAIRPPRHTRRVSGGVTATPGADRPPFADLAVPRSHASLVLLWPLVVATEESPLATSPTASGRTASGEVLDRVVHEVVSAADRRDPP